MPAWLAILAAVLMVIMLTKAIATVVLAHHFHREQSWKLRGDMDAKMAVSVIVPAFNEETTIAACLASMDSQTCPHLEVIVVDDGSTDNTAEVANQVAEGMSIPVRVLTKPNGGKASALNFGVENATGEVVVCVDADSQLATDAVEKVAEPFADPEMGAVGGIVKVRNQRTLLGKQQAMEYVSGLALQRAAFAQIGSLQVMSGAISAFRADALRDVGGYSEDTIVEDFDVTLAIQYGGFKAFLNPEAIAYTEGPLTLRDLVKQRHRWTFGGFQVLGKYRNTLLSSDAGNLSRLGLPYFLVFPWIDVLISVLFILTATGALLSGNILGFLVYFLILSLIGVAMNSYAVYLTGERKRLVFYGFLMTFFYAHVLTYATTRAGWSFITKDSPGWAKLQRSGTEDQQ